MTSQGRRFEMDGAVAQLGERYNGIVEVRGSIPLGSTISKNRVFSVTLADEVSSAGVFGVLERRLLELAG